MITDLTEYRKRGLADRIAAFDVVLEELWITLDQLHSENDRLRAELARERFRLV